jgi:hypothetical protein
LLFVSFVPLFYPISLFFTIIVTTDFDYEWFIVSIAWWSKENSNNNNNNNSNNNVEIKISTVKTLKKNTLILFLHTLKIFFFYLLLPTQKFYFTLSISCEINHQHTKNGSSRTSYYLSSNVFIFIIFFCSRLAQDTHGNGLLYYVYTAHQVSFFMA